MQQNRILTEIIQRHPDARARLTRVDFVHGDLFGRPGEPIRHAVFPVSGMISIVVDLASGDAVEAAMVGYGGVVGASAAFGATDHVNSSFCQLPGAAYLLPAAELAAVAQGDETVRAMLFAHEQFLMVQAQQTAACNAKHHIMQRLATWLLRAKDVTGANEMFLTQEFLAQMLGVQRASVSGFAGQLQDMDLIRYRRGRLTVMDEAGLTRQACECHSKLSSFRRKLFREDGEPLRNAG
ncbi:MAG: Crp/Fnr family transcriptional regulator [Pseudolabrys sp.]